MISSSKGAPHLAYLIALMVAASAGFSSALSEKRFGTDFGGVARGSIHGRAGSPETRLELSFGLTAFRERGVGN